MKNKNVKTNLGIAFFVCILLTAVTMGVACFQKHTTFSMLVIGVSLLFPHALIQVFWARVQLAQCYKETRPDEFKYMKIALVTSLIFLPGAFAPPQNFKALATAFFLATLVTMVLNCHLVNKDEIALKKIIQC